MVVEEASAPGSSIISRDEHIPLMVLLGYLVADSEQVIMILLAYLLD